MATTLQIITNATTDLGSATPFGAGFTVIAVNLTAGSLVVQTSDDGSTWGTGATCGASTSATAMQPVVLKRYVRVSTAATMFLIGG
jgi:20S proteasome alpha/beta subunit